MHICTWFLLDSDGYFPNSFFLLCHAILRYKSFAINLMTNYFSFSMDAWRLFFPATTRNRSVLKWSTTQCQQVAFMHKVKVKHSVSYNTDNYIICLVQSQTFDMKVNVDSLINIFPLNFCWADQTQRKQSCKNHMAFFCFLQVKPK